MKLSIIIPYYKVLDHIKKLFEVLEPQLDDEVEVIIVDDGCNEKELDKLKAKVIHLESNSGGAGKPRNVGIENSTGEYIAFIDADDMITSDYVSEIKKKIEFSSMIGEICAISLENHLQFMNDHSIEGNFVLLGRYKSTSASRIEEEFRYEIPVEIELTAEVDYLNGTIDICDFYYDIVDGNAVLCNIEVCIDADSLEKEDRECDGDTIEEKEIEIPYGM